MSDDTRCPECFEPDGQHKAFCWQVRKLAIPNVEPCQVCGLPLSVGEWPCVTTIRPHGRSVQTTVFSPYYDVGLGEEVTSLAQRWRLMKKQEDGEGNTIRERLEYRDKMSPGALSARLDRVNEERKAATR